MAAYAMPRARFDRGAADLEVDETVRAALLAARPSLEEILSLWPADRRETVVLCLSLDPAGTVAIGARLRDDVFAERSPVVVRQLRRIRHDVPVALELRDGRTLVFPLHAIHPSRQASGSGGGPPRPRYVVIL